MKVVIPSGIAAINGMLLEANAERGYIALTGTDILTRIQCRIQCNKIAEGGKIVIRPIVSEMLRLLAGDTVSFECDGRTAKLESGKAQYTVPVLSAKDYPEIMLPFPGDTVRVENLQPLAKQVMFVVQGREEGAKQIDWQYAKLSFQNGGSHMEATNGKVIAVSASQHTADGDLEILLHHRTLQALSSIISATDELYVGIVDKYVVFMKEGLIVSSLLYDGKGTNGDQILGLVKPCYRAIVDAEEFYQALDNVSTIFTAKDDTCVNLRFNNESVHLESVTAGGLSKTDIHATYVTPTAESGFYYQTQYLLGCLKHMSGAIGVSLDAKGVMLLEGGGSRYMVCPRGPARIRTAEPKKAKSKTTGTKRSRKTAKAA